VNWWRDRWRKKVGSATKYFAFPNSRDGYERACAAYYRLKDEAKPHGREYLADIEETEALSAFHEATGEADIAADYPFVRRLQKRFGRESAAAMVRFVQAG